MLDYQYVISYLYTNHRMFYKKHINPKNILRFPKKISERIMSMDMAAINQMTFRANEGVEPVINIYIECYQEVSKYGSIDQVKYPLECIKDLLKGALEVMNLLGHFVPIATVEHLINQILIVELDINQD